MFGYEVNRIASRALVMRADGPSIQDLKCYASAQQPSPLDRSHHTTYILENTKIGARTRHTWPWP